MQPKVGRVVAWVLKQPHTLVEVTTIEENGGEARKTAARRNRIAGGGVVASEVGPKGRDAILVSVLWKASREWV